MKKILALAATLFISASVFAGEFPDISVKEVKALVASKKAVFIDVNGSVANFAVVNYKNLGGKVLVRVR